MKKTRLFQIWIEPRTSGGDPSWDAKSFPKGDRANQLEILVSGFDEDIANGALMIRADARLYGATLTSASIVQHDIADGAQIYLVGSAGRLRINRQEVTAGDALASAIRPALQIEATEDAELVFIETHLTIN